MMTTPAPVKGWRPGRHVVPGNWKTLKAKVLKEQRGICHVCHAPGATEVDHVVNLARGGTHHGDNLAPIHPEPCHAEKTKREAAEGRALKSGRRPTRPHPGLAAVDD